MIEFFQFEDTCVYLWNDLLNDVRRWQLIICYKKGRKCLFQKFPIFIFCRLKASWGIRIRVLKIFNRLKTSIYPQILVFKFMFCKYPIICNPKKQPTNVWIQILTTASKKSHQTLKQTSLSQLQCYWENFIDKSPLIL